MPAPLEDIEALFTAVKNLRDERRKMAKLSECAFAADSVKARSKSTVDLNWQAFHVTRLEHAVHAAAVNAGLADIRSADHYRPYTVNLSGWHTYEMVPALPRGMHDRINRRSTT